MDANEAIDHMNAVIAYLQTKPDLDAIIKERNASPRFWVMSLKLFVDRALGMLETDAPLDDSLGGFR